MKLLQWLMAFLAHTTWRRIGGSGAVPPLRLPKRDPIHFRPLSPWQLFIAMWLLNKFWKSYGERVKTQMMIARNPLVNKLGSWLPDPG